MLPLLPDVERAVAFWLLARPELAGLDGRVYTATPKGVGEAPFVLVRRVGGEPVVRRPLVLERATLQLDSYGGTKAAAQRWARIVAALLDELAGVVDDGTTQGYVSGVEVGALRDLPDEAFEPARTRYVLDVDVVVKSRPAAAPLGGEEAAAVVPAAVGSSSTS